MPGAPKHLGATLVLGRVACAELSTFNDGDGTCY